MSKGYFRRGYNTKRYNDNWESINWNNKSNKRRSMITTNITVMYSPNCVELEEARDELEIGDVLMVYMDNLESGDILLVACSIKDTICTRNVSDETSIEDVMDIVDDLVTGL